MALARLTRVTRNRKTGPVPVSYSDTGTCPLACSLREGACYAKNGPVSMAWRRVDQNGSKWAEFCETVARVIPRGRVWRHNVAGDLPGDLRRLDFSAIARLVRANAGRLGWTYTHYACTPEAAKRGDCDRQSMIHNQEVVAYANAYGFAVNVSVESLSEVDSVPSVLPVAVILESSAHGTKVHYSPNGRKVVTCPATYREDTDCERCQLCIDPKRGFAIGFPAHGARKRTVDRIVFVDRLTQGKGNQ